MSLYFDHEFDAPIRHHDVGSERYRYTVVYLPEDHAEALPLDEFPRLRISGEVNDCPFEAALTPVSGVWYILFSKKTLREIGAGVGDMVTVRYRIADQDAVDVPELLATALNKSKKIKRLWDDQTPGKQRALAYRVASAKRAETQNKRIIEVFDILQGKRDLRGNRIDS